jgi:hypothetical protein
MLLCKFMIDGGMYSFVRLCFPEMGGNTNLSNVES